MKISDVISMCVSNLTRRKVRTLLTVIGVVVGTCAIMVMVSLGLGMQASQDAMLEQMGDLTVIQVYNYNNSAEELVLDDEAVATMAAMEGVDVATPFWQPWQIDTEVVSGSNDRYQMSYPTIIGVYPEAMEKFGYVLDEGRFATETDKDYTVVVGQNFAYSFRDTKRKRDNYIWADPDPVTGELPDPFVDIFKDDMVLRTMETEDNPKVIEHELRVVGTIQTDWSKGWETDSGIFMDIEVLKSLVAEYNKENDIRSSDGQKGYTDVRVRVKDIDLVAGVEDQIQAMGFETYSMESMREPMQEQSRQQQLILGGLGFISLFVAAIGITNTMIMSIYERTREIGVMKVLGCRLGNIRAVFLMEAGLIGFMGGVIGVLISCGISWVLNYLSAGGGLGGLSGLLGGSYYYYGGDTVGISIIPPWLIAVSLVFSTLVGLVSGFGPANRAVKISALAAIKQE